MTGNAQNARADLPIGTPVRVTPVPVDGRQDQSYIALIVGHDASASKYQVVRQLSPRRYAFRVTWLVPGEVEEVAVQ